MTRDQYREQCIEAMIRAIGRAGCDDGYLALRAYALAALESIRTAGALVNPVEATDEMCFAADIIEQEYLEKFGEMPRGSAYFRAMARTGDLSNPPEGKP